MNIRTIRWSMVLSALVTTLLLRTVLRSNQLPRTEAAYGEYGDFLGI